MSWVNAAPEFVAAAANDLAGIGSSLSAANAAAAFPTSGVIAAGADEISAVIASLFGAHAQAYQTLSSQAAAFHQQFVQLMTAGASQYDAAEASNAAMQDASAAASGPAQAVPGLAAGGGAANGSPTGVTGDERVLLRRDGGTLVQLGNNAGGGAGGSSAYGAGGANGVIGSGGGSAGAAGLLPGLRGNPVVSVIGDANGVSVLPDAAVAGPADGLGQSASGFGGIGPVPFGQGAANGLGVSAAPAASSAPAAAGPGNSGQAENSPGIAVHSGWLQGDGGLAADTALFGDSAAGDSAAMAGDVQPSAADQFANGGGHESFFSGRGGFYGGSDPSTGVSARADGAVGGV